METYEIEIAPEGTYLTAIREDGTSTCECYQVEKINVAMPDMPDVSIHELIRVYKKFTV